ncbi:hypothetical protein RFI_22862 [Reticulomyxa filosa]|uniref:Uncharacterized protein n=1 Tax=Reticulomyxa filosa TaxID=46433 RepID=X6MM40_RETFI|nr:hypothetical protein RFI_22862 [Reticulomyxa filosa]|eukprot:ETO14502.1 hypothetical protein RFI_22862 [Reticulomyxa filosa]
MNVYPRYTILFAMVIQKNQLFQRFVFRHLELKYLNNEFIMKSMFNYEQIISKIILLIEGIFYYWFTKCTILGNLRIFSIMVVSYMYTGHIFENEFLDDKLSKLFQSKSKYRYERIKLDYRKENSVSLALQGTYAIEIPFFISMSTALILNLL